MTRPEDAVSLDEEHRAFVVAMLQKMPESLSKAMLAEESTRAALGLPTGGSIIIFNARFEASAVMALLRAVANGVEPELRSINGAVSVDEARLDPDGAAILIAGDQGARFASVGLLADDVDVRRRTLEAVLTDEDLEPTDEARLRTAVEAGPVGEGLFVELETMVEATPKAVYRRMAADAAEGVAYDALVPEEEQFFKALLGLPPPATMGEYRAGWLARAALLDPVRRARWIALTAPLSILRGDLPVQAARELDREVRLRLATFLAGAPDPISRLAAFELTAAESADSDFKAIGDRLLPELLDRQNERTATGLSLLNSAVILTSTVSARRGTLSHWPVYARRLACYLHASVLIRTFGNGAIDAGEMLRLIGRPLEGNSRLVELCDARLAPFNQWGAISPDRLHATITARIGRTVAGLPDERRSQDWSDAVDAATTRPDALLQLAAGPLDPFEDDWAGLVQLTGDMVDETIGRLDTGENDERALSDLFNIAVAFDVEPERRPEVADRVPKFLERLPDETFTQAADLSLQLAARWKLPDLAERTIDLTLSKRAAGTAMNPGAPARFGLLGGASNADAGMCAKKTGEYFNSFAFAAKAGIEVDNMLAAIDLIGDFAPSLRPALASARSFALLGHDAVRTKAFHGPEAQGSSAEIRN